MCSVQKKRSKTHARLVRSARFLKTAMRPTDYPAADRPEVALVGRSNAGKSSLLNALCGRKLAHVAATPGKTRTIQFYDFGALYRVVDLPGYGYAARSQKEIDSWSKYIKIYLDSRENLVGALLIMDCRRNFEDEEELLIQWWQERSLPWYLVANKMDRLNQSEKHQCLKRLSKQLNSDDIYMVSAKSGLGVSELEEAIYRRWIGGRDE